MVLIVTGHRPNKLGNDYEMKGKLAQKIRAEIKAVIASESPSRAITGMALGIDQLFAHVCIEENVPFIAALPHKGQEKIWPIRSQDVYFSLLQCAESIALVDVGQMLTWHQYLEAPCGLYIHSKMDDRNKWMVDYINPLEDKVLAVWDGSAGGTRNCVLYAKKKKRNIIYINPKTL